MARFLSIRNWERFQHYKDRDPPWVKLYRDTLTSEVWVLGTDTSRLMQLASTLLAARYSNQIPLNFALWKKVAHLDCDEAAFTQAVAHLVEHEYLEIHEVEDKRKQDASALLASCTSEREAEAEKRERRNTTASATPAKVSRETEPDWFLDFKLAYPNRAGDQGWRKALKAGNARIAEGHDPGEFIAGAQRYAAYCEAAGKTGTEYVKQAATFLGPDKHFTEPWRPPPSKAQRQQDANVSAAMEFLRNSGDEPH